MALLLSENVLEIGSTTHWDNVTDPQAATAYNLLVRYIACLALEISAPSEDKQSQFRVFQIFLKATKFCIGFSSLFQNVDVDTNTLELATKLMERAAQVSVPFI